MRSFLRATLLAVMATACSNAGESLTLASATSTGAGRVTVDLFFDRDGSNAVSVGDTAVGGVRIALLLPGAHDTLRVGTATTGGVVVFDSLPFGTYRVVVDRHALADSVGVILGDTGSVRIIGTADSFQVTRVIGLGYSTVSIADVRALPVGRRTFVRGVVTVPLQLFTDTSTFIGDSSGVGLRISNAHPSDGLTRNGNGDSVLILGTVATRAGQVVLDKGSITTKAIGPAIVPQVVSFADAKSARAGKLDAALVKVNSMIIQDTATVSGVFTLRASDPADTTGTNRIDIQIDPGLNAPASFFPAIGSPLTVTGVLVPNGTGVWAIKPRQAGDFAFQ